MNIDIGFKEKDRIYGIEWYERLAKSKCTLLSESGSSLVDMDGRLWKLLNDPNNFNETEVKSIFNRLDKNIDAKTISPRLFEAIYFKTAIIAFPEIIKEYLKKKIT